METLETLGKRIATTRDLQSIVRTMKSLSAVSIRQYEKAATALLSYTRTIELGLQVVLRDMPLSGTAASGGELGTAAIVFGSDHGLCGKFNEEISGFAHAEMQRRIPFAKDRHYLAVGFQSAARLEGRNEAIDDCLNLPGSVTGLTMLAHAILNRIDAWQTDADVGRVLLFHNARTAETTATPTMLQLLPLDDAWLRDLARRHWPSRILPTHSMDGQALFASLVREHLFASIFRAGAESMASEHATRLAAMQTAERNIKEHLEEMTAAFRHRRQQAITEELLDVVAGFETLRTEQGAFGESESAELL